MIREVDGCCNIFRKIAVKLRMKTLVNNIFLLCLLCLTLMVVGVKGQSGGYDSYRFVNLPLSAKQLSLGGMNYAHSDNDFVGGMFNPAMNDTMMHHTGVFTFSTLFDNIRYGVFSYAYSINRELTLRILVQNVGYGKFEETDEIGNVTGTFKASDNVFGFSAGYNVWQGLYMGGALKVLYSDYYYQQSTVIMMDFGGWYESPDERWSGSVLVQNAGMPIKNYVKGNRPSMPFRINTSFGVHPENMPFKFHISYNDWQKFNLTEDTLTRNERIQLYGTPDSNKIGFMEKFMRHVGLGVEFVPGTGFALRYGMDYRRRKEFVFASRKGLIGYSAGFEVMIKKFRFSYGLSAYHLGYTQHMFTLSKKLANGRMKNKRKAENEG